MREKTARKIMSGWSAFRLGMTQPELTVLAVGEWDRPIGVSEWGVVIRDLRTGEQRLVFSEEEWERIKRQGLPAVGTEWGEPISAITASPEVESLIEAERDLYRSTYPVEAPVEETDWSMPEILGYLDFELGEQFANERAFEVDESGPLPTFTTAEVTAIGDAIRRGTPEPWRYAVKMDAGEPAMEALIGWVRAQRRSDGDTAELKAVLAGDVDINLATGHPSFAPRR